MEEVKVVLLGNSGVGKTSIINRFVFDKFNETTPASLSGALFSQTIIVPQNNIEVKFCLWDTAGQERYHSLAPRYYKDANIVLIIYDVTSTTSFEGAKNWLEEVKNKSRADATIMLMGNKADCVFEEEVDLETVQKFAEINFIKHVIVSAKDDTGISDVFQELAYEFSKIIKKNAEERANGKTMNTSVRIKSGVSKPKKRCC